MMSLLRKISTSQIAACASQTIDRTGYFMKSCIDDIYFVSVRYLQRIIRRNITFQVNTRFPKYSPKHDLYTNLHCVFKLIHIQFKSGSGQVDTDKLLDDIFIQNVQQNIFSTISKGQFRFSGSFPVLLKPYPVIRVYEDDLDRGVFHASPLFTRY
jgi:hypothetical protein